MNQDKIEEVNKDKISQLEQEPDESRLLTDGEFLEWLDGMNLISTYRNDPKLNRMAQDAKTASLKDAQFIEWLTKHGSQQQVDLWNGERFEVIR